MLASFIHSPAHSSESQRIDVQMSFETFWRIFSSTKKEVVLAGSSRNLSAKCWGESQDSEAKVRGSKWRIWCHPVLIKHLLFTSAVLSVDSRKATKMTQPCVLSSPSYLPLRLELATFSAKGNMSTIWFSRAGLGRCSWWGHR
jgi:hypothetical protein